MFMRLIGPILGRLGIGQVRDRYRLAWTRFRSPGRIETVDVPRIQPPWHITLKPGAVLRIGKGVRFGPNFGAYVERGLTLEIGDECNFTSNAWIAAAGSGITIGSRTGIGPNTSVMDSNHRFGQEGVAWDDAGIESEHVSIGDHVWIGGNCTIMTSVGDESVVGANAVVSRPVPPRSLAMGVPARVVRQLPSSRQSSASDDAAGGAR